MSLAALAGVGAAGAYLDAKFHLRKDITSLWSLKSVERQFAKAVKEKRLGLYYYFEDQVKRLPATEQCIWDRTAQYTWRETYTHVNRYAQFFISLGVQPHELVAFYLTNSPEFVLALLGTWAIGTAPAMINYNLAGEGLLHCLRTSSAKVMLVDEDSEVRARMEEVREKVEGELGIRIVVLDAATKAEIMALEPKRPEDSYRDGTLPSDSMGLFYTSGTTGFPKAVNFTIQRTWSVIAGRMNGLGISPGPNGGRWYNCMPMYHGTGGNVVMMCLCRGITLCIGKKFRASTFWDDIRDSEATAFVYVGETARYLMATPPSPRDKQHKVTMMFGNGLRPDIWQPFQKRFGVETVSEFFNSTEGVFGTLNVSKGDYLATSVGQHGGLIRLLTRKTVIPVEIDHETNEIARDPATGFAKRKPYTEGGEVIIKVPNKEASGFAGYYKNPSATNKKFAADVFEKGDLYYRSGDSLRRDDDGRWFFMDRLGDTFRWKSENVSTAEVAVVLGKYPGILEANVYGVLLPKHDGRAGCAAIYIDPNMRQGFDFGMNGLLGYLRKQLPKYAVPVFLRVIGGVELGAQMHNNKQNKVPLREEGVEHGKVRAGKGGRDDVLMWVIPKGDRYVEFRQEDWDAISAGKAKL